MSDKSDLQGTKVSVFSVILHNKTVTKGYYADNAKNNITSKIITTNELYIFLPCLVIH